MSPGMESAVDVVTNLDVEVMAANEVIGKYHDLWHVERSFRMSKTDLEARPCSTAPRGHRSAPDHRVHRVGRGALYPATQ